MQHTTAVIRHPHLAAPASAEPFNLPVNSGRLASDYTGQRQGQSARASPDLDLSLFNQ